jgi:hypothetical protein
MRILLKKLAFTLLTLAIISMSAQVLFASSIHKCDAENVAALNNTSDTGSNSHCDLQKTDKICTCDDCGCDMNISNKTSITLALQSFSHYLQSPEIVTATTSIYTQHFQNPLLRPPIA